MRPQLREPTRVTVPCGADGIEVWRVDLDSSREPDGTVLCDLSDVERLRLDSFRAVGDRARFAAMRSALRRILGEVLDVHPQTVPIQLDANGKPQLQDRDRQFSISHSGDVGMIALGSQAAVGIDVERLRDLEDVSALAVLALSPDDRRRLDNADAEARTALFFRMWTAKEALLKSTGRGFLLDPCTLSVLDGDALSVSGDPSLVGFDPASARVCALPALDGYVAALATLPVSKPHKQDRSEPAHA